MYKKDLLKISTVLQSKVKTNPNTTLVWLNQTAAFGDCHSRCFRPMSPCLQTIDSTE